MVIKKVMVVFNLFDRDIFLLCMEKSCLAFAGTVYMDTRLFQDYPHLNAADIEDAPETC